jgi:hypothetical protein
LSDVVSGIKKYRNKNIYFEKTRVTNLGHYMVGSNAFGIKDNINLNRSHLSRPLWEILATLLHEMSHSWQAMYGKPSSSWFHNKEFKLKMMEFGIICNAKGYHKHLRDPSEGKTKGPIQTEEMVLRMYQYPCGCQRV